MPGLLLVRFVDGVEFFFALALELFLNRFFVRADSEESTICGMIDGIGCLFGAGFLLGGEIRILGVVSRQRLPHVVARHVVEKHVVDALAVLFFVNLVENSLFFLCLVFEDVHDLVAVGAEPLRLGSVVQFVGLFFQLGAIDRWFVCGRFWRLLRFCCLLRFDRTVSAALWFGRIICWFAGRTIRWWLGGFLRFCGILFVEKIECSLEIRPTHFIFHLLLERHTMFGDVNVVHDFAFCFGLTFKQCVDFVFVSSPLAFCCSIKFVGGLFHGLSVDFSFFGWNSWFRVFGWSIILHRRREVCLTAARFVGCATRLVAAGLRLFGTASGRSMLTWSCRTFVRFARCRLGATTHGASWKFFRQFDVLVDVDSIGVCDAVLLGDFVYGSGDVCPIFKTILFCDNSAQGLALFDEVVDDCLRILRCASGKTIGWAAGRLVLPALRLSVVSWLSGLLLCYLAIAVAITRGWLLLRKKRRQLGGSIAIAITRGVGRTSCGCGIAWVCPRKPRILSRSCLFATLRLSGSALLGGDIISENRSSKLIVDCQTAISSPNHRSLVLSVGEYMIALIVQRQSAYHLHRKIRCRAVKRLSYPSIAVCRFVI